MQHIEHASLMAKLAGLSYLDGPQAKPKFKELGFTSHKFIEHDGAQCHIVLNKEMLVLCFRGTEPAEFSDIKADLNALPDKAQVGGWVHNGFQNEVEKIWDPITAYIKRNLKERELFICGHSLGGAMATIAASRLHENVTCLYTYGSPRVGTRSFLKQCGHIPHYRHVNNNDIVPKVPFAFLGYKHHGTLRYINFYGNIRNMSWWQRFKDGWRGRVAAWKKRQPFDGARDHGMDNYIKYLEDK